MILQIRGNFSLGILLYFLNFYFKLCNNFFFFFKQYLHFLETDKLRVFCTTKFFDFSIFLCSNDFDTIFYLIFDVKFYFRRHFQKDVCHCRDFLEQGRNFLVCRVIKHFIRLQFINCCQNIFFILAILRQKLELELSNGVKCKLYLVLLC